MPRITYFHQWLYDPSQILTQELISGLVQSAQVLDSGANQWSGSVRADLAYRVIGCEIVCIINAKAMDYWHRMMRRLPLGVQPDTRSWCALDSGAKRCGKIAKRLRAPAALTTVVWLLRADEV